MADGNGKSPEYFVRGEDGQLYGPATFEQLREWVAQDRVRSETVLVHSETKESFKAIDVPGLIDTAVPPKHVTPPPAAPFYAPPQPAPVKSSGVVVAIIALCVCGFGGVVLAAILLPVFASARVAATKTQGLSNLKRLSLGVLMYCSEYDEHYPKDMSSAEALRPKIAGYVGDPKVFISPNPKPSEYLGNAKLAGRSAEAVVDPARTIMLYDREPWNGSRSMVSFADGSARMLGIGLDIRQELARNPFK